MIGAVIPVKDEDGVCEFAASVARFVDWVLIEDDSVTIASCPTASVVVQRGVGCLAGSVLDGLATFHESVWNADRVVTIDAGGSHDPTVIPALLNAMYDHNADVVIGSRFHPMGFHLGPAWRRWASKMYGRFWKWATWYPVRDWTSGYRVYSRRALELLGDTHIKALGHSFQAEVLIECLRAGLKVVEVPIYYRPSGSSLTKKTSREAWRTFRRLAWV